ncbi:hypothetical protein GW17_00029683, partial [Ensete ventricosum]
VHVSYSWKPQRCKDCLSFGNANGVYQQPSKIITQIYRPRQEPEYGVATSTDTQDTSPLVPIVMAMEKMIVHSNLLGQQHKQEKDKSEVSSLPIMLEHPKQEFTMVLAPQ